MVSHMQGQMCFYTNNMYSRKTKDYTEGLLLTRVQTDRLIDLYKADQGLWDLASPVYHNKDKRKKALQYILGTLKEEYAGFEGTVDQLQYKLSNLRGYYSRELSKIRKSQRNPSEETYASSWRLFDPLDSFLREQITPRKYPTNPEVTFKTEPEDYDSDEEMFLVSDDSEEPSSLSFQKNLPVIHGPYQQSTETESQENDTRIENTNRIKRPKLSPAESAMVHPEYVPPENDNKTKIKGQRFPAFDTMTTETDYTDNNPVCVGRKSEENKTNISEEDDDSLFARYIAMELRKIRDPRTKAFVKFKIHSIIYESQFGTISQNIGLANSY